MKEPLDAILQDPKDTEVCRPQSLNQTKIILAPIPAELLECSMLIS